MSTHSHPMTEGAPTVEHPEQGVIGSAGVPLFPVEHWVEDGEHVFHSSEFDLVVGDADFDAAIEKFIEGADDLWGFLEEQKNLTEGEIELVSLIASRFRALLQELERRERARRRPLITIRLPRRGVERLGTWRPANQTPDSSSHFSHA